MSRSYKLELIDQGPDSGHYTLDEYHDCLHQLGRIGRLIGGDRATLKAFSHLSPTSILDVGCGGGQFTARLAHRFPQAEVLGIDIDSTAVAYARQYAPSLSNLTFEESGEMKGSWSVVTATLVCHHLNDEQLVTFLQQACAAATQRVILNDLHRHWTATAAFGATAPLFFRNRLIVHDGLLSIRRAFKKSDLHHYLQQAGIPLAACRITWHLGFRWTIEINTTQL